jgi:DNA-binding XRE family transcriptional regulator
MSEPTEVQTIYHDGKPAFAVVPYATYLRLLATRPRVPAGDAVPHEVMRLHLVDGLSLRRAWREYLQLTQAEVATRMGVSQPALSQLESPRARPRRATLARLAKALGVRLEQLK